MPSSRAANHPDYLVIGHVARDIVPGEAGESYTPGGTVTYSALAAQRLGVQAAVVTACAPADSYLLDGLREEGVLVHVVDSPTSTSFRNVYDAAGHRTQMIRGQAASIGYEDIPAAWLGAPIVHLGPIAQELPHDMPSRFKRCLLGVTPQGWMRSWDGEGRVQQSAWPVPDALRSLPSNALLVLSVEDLDNRADLVPVYAGLAPRVVITAGAGEAHLFHEDTRASVPALHADMLDPTGAGDVFATALLVRYHETADLAASILFAHAAAACAIEGFGTQTIPARALVELRVPSSQLPAGN